MKSPRPVGRIHTALTIAPLLLPLVGATALVPHPARAQTQTQAQTQTLEVTSSPMVDSPTWGEIAGDILEDPSVKDGTALFTIDAPYRAEDAATVPVVIHQMDLSQTITDLKLVIDENPSPLAASFHFGSAMHPLELETRVRVNQYSNLRALAETPDGIFMHGRYIKASGGCSAPATKDSAAALKGIGKMRLRVFEPTSEEARSTGWREAQIMIRHPNYSGLQMNQLTQLYIPALFIHELTVRQGDDLLFSMEGGISISENPVFRFGYKDNGSPTLRVHAVDTEGNVFDEVLSKGQG
ncbi:MAG: quinoprotein dehydrogenase-associated SoxYZ-like carrier [Rhodospirillum sp.]|nr:quinoprotein dehydrogenase-associated SoxYZ-like carrier [Rhodospirillum sp.]MCF8489671.1 quinoprotein dehydrogenase-associated SoxYZ-like carrier [Rhodospirillum sp.]MCF8501489.1 quinoprotein dehydrogenase-associated SoxYZ-like carrier [Rhodospirillum sp.]